jgi:hypothetical protein
MQSLPLMDAATELPLVDTPDTPAWSENYCFDGFDRTNDIGFWLHMGRWQRNKNIWREQVLLYLPDGDHLLMRAYGALPHDNGPGGALMRFQCIEPGRKWRLRYSGPARRVTLDDMMADPQGHITDGPYVAVSFDLIFDAIKPVWDMGDMAGENWASFHYEQHGRISGEITYEMRDGAQRSLAMDGGAYRDHSRGVRDLTNFGGFYWNHCVFPSGRGFSVVHSYKSEDGRRSDGISRAVIYDGERIIAAQIENAPVLQGRDLPPPRYTFKLTSELGDMVIEGRPVRTIAQSSDIYNNQFDGIATPDIGVLFCFEQPTEYHWNGEIGEGWTERAERC